MFERLRETRPEARIAAFAAVVWVIQPFVTGPLIGDALDPTDNTFRTATSWGAWLGWLLVLIALAVPRPLTLTIARIGAPAVLPGAIWAATESNDTTVTVVGLTGAAIAALSVLAPGIGDRFVDGASYGDERRFVLRPPGPVLIGALLPTWVITVVGVAAGPLLLADERWLAGGVVLAVGLGVAAIGFRALLRLTERFVVFVPNGFVVHDGTVLREPVLFTKTQIAGLGPAVADSTALDLTAAALGLALELKLGSSTTLPVVTGRTETEDTKAQALLIAPSRPATVMRVAQDHGIPLA